MLGHFTFEALGIAGLGQDLFHVFGGRYSSRTIAGKEVLGIEELLAGSDTTAAWMSMEAVGRALSDHLQRTAYLESWPDKATIQLTLVPPRFAAEASPRTPQRPPREPDKENYASPYTRGRGIRHSGVTVVDM